MKVSSVARGAVGMLTAPRDGSPLALALVVAEPDDAVEMAYLLTGSPPPPAWRVFAADDLADLSVDTARALSAADVVLCYARTGAANLASWAGAVAVCGRLNLNTVAVLLDDGRRAATAAAVRAAVPFPAVQVASSKQELVERLARLLASEVSLGVRPRLAHLELMRAVLRDREERDVAALVGAALASVAVAGPFALPVAADLVGSALELVDAVEEPDERRVSRFVVAAAVVAGLASLDERRPFRRFLAGVALPAAAVAGAYAARRRGVLERAAAVLARLSSTRALAR